jgi:hypothetical protein
LPSSEKLPARLRRPLPRPQGIQLPAAPDPERTSPPESSPGPPLNPLPLPVPSSS